MPDEAKTMARTRLISRLNWVDGELAKSAYLMGDDFCVADGYLFVVAGWSKHVGIDISGLDHLVAFMARVGARKAVQEALRAEGLLN
jgi:glutathione S-transferase